MVAYKSIARIDVLNFTSSVAGSLLVRGSILVSIFMPSARAFGGIRDRKSRAGFARGEKGLNWTRTSVRNRVIMLAIVQLGARGGLTASTVCQRVYT